MTANELKKFKPGQEIRLAGDIFDYFDKYSFSDNAVNSLLSEEHAKDYFIRKAIAIGMPYKAEVIRLADDVGGNDDNPLPGALIRMYVGPFFDKTYLSHENLGHVNPPAMEGTL